MISQVQVRRADFAQTRIAALPTPELADGEVLLAIDKFALTANNVSYALAGDMIGYWTFFPVDETFGLVPVWGFADVVASKCDSVPVGERVWGFLPMASHTVVTPGKVGERSFIDAAAHRAALPAVYNTYQRTNGDPAPLKAIEDQRCLLFPLFSTSYVLYDYLIDNAFFGAKQVVVASASSKTGLGLTNLLSRHGEGRPKVIGLTSPRNVDFVKGLNTCDEVVTYEAIADMDGSVPTAFVDMAGDRNVITSVHGVFGANLKLSCAVGATHWETGGFRPLASSISHDFFFAPAQFAKRDAEWGAGEILRRAQGEAVRMAGEVAGVMEIRHTKGPDAVAAVWKDLVANAISPTVAIMASL